MLVDKVILFFALTGAGTVAMLILTAVYIIFSAIYDPYAKKREGLRWK